MLAKQAKQAVVVMVFNGVLKSIKHFESHSTLQNIIFQDYCRPHIYYLLKIACMDQEQAVFEQFNFKRFQEVEFDSIKKGTL